MLFTTGQSPGSAVGLNLRTRLYVGGVDQSSVRVSPGVGVDRGFTGCISQVTFTYLQSPVHESVSPVRGTTAPNRQFLYRHHGHHHLCFDGCESCLTSYLPRLLRKRTLGMVDITNSPLFHPPHFMYINVLVLCRYTSSAGFTNVGACLIQMSKGPGSWPLLTFFIHFPLFREALLWM